MSPTTISPHQKASLIRRLLAISYDSLLCIALMFVVTGIYMAISYKLLGPEAYKELNDSGQTIKDPLLTTALGLSLYLFFGYFWTKSGQTLGMQVWHLRVQNPDKSLLSWKQAMVRFAFAALSAAIFGLGYIWILFDSKGQSLHCKISKSEVVHLPKPTK